VPYAGRHGHARGWDWEGVSERDRWPGAGSARPGRAARHQAGPCSPGDRYDDDCDELLREQVASGDGVELVDEDYEDVVDGYSVWRERTGTWSMPSSTPRHASDGGYIVLLTRRLAAMATSSERDRGKRHQPPAVTDIHGERGQELVGQSNVAPKARPLSLGNAGSASRRCHAMRRHPHGRGRLGVSLRARTLRFIFLSRGRRARDSVSHPLRPVV